MCDQYCIDFVKKFLNVDNTTGKRVIEVASRYVNGSSRPSVLELHPNEYIGCDIIEGKNVDIICDVNDLVNRFGKNSFDIVINTEMLEHVIDWRNAVSNMKNILKPNGWIIITTRSIGFGKHEFPCDHWRYQEEDMLEIFSDFKVIATEIPPPKNGIFISAIKPEIFIEKDTTLIKLYHIDKRERILDVPKD
jgi:SAM-dependent methyltransferase